MTARIHLMLAGLANETHKELLVLWSYRFNILVGALTLSGMFLAMAVSLGADDLPRFESRPSFLLGFMITLIAMGALQSIPWNLRNAAQNGTLEQVAMSPNSLIWLVQGRFVAEFIVQIVIIAVLGAVATTTLGFSLPLRAEGLPVLLLVLLGLTGFGLALGGATLVFKNVAALTNILTNLLLFTNGTLVAVDEFAGPVALLTRLLPTTQGIIVLRALMLGDESLAAVWNDGSLLWLAVHSLITFGIGLAIFDGCLTISRRRGTLGQY